MVSWLRELDRLLRGELTQVTTLRARGFELPLRGTVLLIVLLGCITGACMATFALLRPDECRWQQLVASTVKVPALFLLTLLVTFPSLYVFNSLMGSRLRFMSNLRLLVGALGVTLAVVASFGPIVAFFSLSTTNYPFIVLLNVVTFGIAGALGLAFLILTLHRLSLVELEPTHVEATSSKSPQPNEVVELPALEAFLEEAGWSTGSQTESTAAPKKREPLPVRRPESALERLPKHVLGAHIWLVFRIWVVVFALVGSQMSWILRPFIGNPNEPFTWFRPRQSSFFEAVWHAFWNMF